jgi:hypothetical protein
MHSSLLRTRVYLLTAIALLSVSISAAEDQWQDVERIVAVGDIHGDYEHFVEVLTSAGLINRRGNWIGEDTHFVQTGDIPDRGPDTDKIIEHMQRLERQAERDGGMVHALIGNHEAMNMLGDVRYVHPGEYAAFRSRRSRQMRSEFYDRYIRQLTARNPEFVEDDTFRESFYAQYPLGFVEQRRAWDKQGEIGAWVVEHNSIIKINRVLFMHGGISPEVLGTSITEINEQIRSEFRGDRAEEAVSAEAENGVLWYRGLANNDELLEQAHVNAVLEFYDVDHIVLGHTPGLGTIYPRFGGKVIVIDTGISNYYGAHLASLLIENGELTTLQRGEQIRIPNGDESLLPYFQAVAELEPNADALNVLIKTLELPSPISPPQ